MQECVEHANTSKKQIEAEYMHQFLYRGFNTELTPGIEYENTYIENPRRPRDTPEAIQTVADMFFYKQFGYRFRSQSLFCTGSREIASKYGFLRIVEPIGENCLCWSPVIKDFFYYYSMRKDTAFVEDLLKDGKYETFEYADSSKLEVAMASHHEIMVWCTKYKVHLANKHQL